MSIDRLARRLAAGLTATALLVPAALAQDAGEMPQCQVREFAMGLRYQQQSAEVQALQLQAFALATERLDAAVAKAEDPSKLAVVTDLDETVIDNSALLVRDMQECHQYDTWDTWGFWEREGKPTLIPGAKEFLDHADKAGVAIYYISDRFGENKPSTIATLNELGLPQASDDQVLLYGTTKVERRGVVSKDHQIILLLGDTLHDFDGVFHKADTATKRQKVEENRAHFGTDWIVLPNATYGEWSEAPLTGWDAVLKTE